MFHHRIKWEMYKHLKAPNKPTTDMCSNFFFYQRGKLLDSCGFNDLLGVCEKLIPEDFEKEGGRIGCCNRDALKVLKGRFTTEVVLDEDLYNKSIEEYDAKVNSLLLQFYLLLCKEVPLVDTFWSRIAFDLAVDEIKRIHSGFSTSLFEDLMKCFEKHHISMSCLKYRDDPFLNGVFLLKKYSKNNHPIVFYCDIDGVTHLFFGETSVYLFPEDRSALEEWGWICNSESGWGFRMS